MLNKNYYNYVIKSVILRSYVQSMKKDKPYSYKLIRTMKHPSEGAGIRVSRHATKLMICPSPLHLVGIVGDRTDFRFAYPTLEQSSSLSKITENNKKQAEQASKIKNPSLAWGIMYSDDLDYMTKWPNYANFEMSLSSIKDVSWTKEDQEVFETEIASISSPPSNPKEIDDWVKIKDPLGKQYNEKQKARRLRLLERQYKCIYTKFNDELEFHHYIYLAAEKYYEETSIKNFYVIAQRRCPMSNDAPLEFNAAVFIVDAYEEEDTLLFLMDKKKK